MPRGLNGGVRCRHMKRTGLSRNDTGGQADQDSIIVRGARQNNLRGLDLDIPTRQLVVVTGVSGCGKSSLVFDTLYAEGQRRYVETFSPYARQFLDRMDKPAVDRIEGIPPAIAIDQTNPVRTSRSTVGTMTELNDHLKLLFARTASLYCKQCAAPVQRDTPQGICQDLLRRAANETTRRIVVCFTVEIPKNFSRKEIESLLDRQGYTRRTLIGKNRLEVVQDRLRLDPQQTSRLTEAVETALSRGRGRIHVHFVSANDVQVIEETLHYSTGLHCASCDIAYREPSSSSFSFNSPAGACEACRGFGRIIGVDYGLVIPDTRKTLREGAIRPWQTDAYRECQQDLQRLARKRGIPLDTPWCDLDDETKHWVIEGEGEWAKNVWYGVRRFFTWLESKAYKMHIRVLLSKYRAYTPCTACHGARLNSESLLWRLGDSALAAHTLANRPRFQPAGTHWTDTQLSALPGLCVHDLMLLPISKTRYFFDNLSFLGNLDQATELLLGEIRSRFAFLEQVGLGYLTLDRQSRTLSGGEVQRINLTTALGTSLVNTLFVLDEPSIGLHPRDMQRVIDVMHRLRDAGNSLLVVEHDPQIMQQADLLIDIGPGAGEHGGNIVAFGPPSEVCAQRDSLTADYLSGRKRVALPPSDRSESSEPTRWMELIGARQHNLKDINVRFPLNRLVCLTGVSGSGKSTLLQDILHPALLKFFGRPTEAPGEFSALHGVDSLTDVVFVDQTPIGRTARSNPASYVGAFDVLRDKFARLPQAKERGYTAGTFSFNSGTGRCPSCSGSGFEHVEMQFLSDVYLRCGDCDGRRYRAETLEIQHPGPAGRHASIADVLSMTVTEACAFFSEMPEVAARLMPLLDVGLDYLRLGQPVPTLSGGEAQRLKLAGHLADSAQRESGPKLFLFDEPTTGLHFEDIGKLLKAFRKLIDAGHSLIVIEHNLDVIAAAQWLIDLGPEGGDQGGQVIAAGTPRELMDHPRSHTGTALRAHLDAHRKTRNTRKRSTVTRSNSNHRVAENQRAVDYSENHSSIRIHNAREHNLKEIDVQLPRGAFNVITGVSGSGKSTLAFDIIFNEGQRRYLESLNAYARQFVQPASKPEVDSIRGIPPTVAIEQRTSRGGRKSTVATLTEIYHFLRVLYVKLGVQYCPSCAVPIEPQSPDAIVAKILRHYRGQTIDLLAPLIVARKGLYTDLAKWAAGKGYRELRVDGQRIPVKPWPRLDRFKEHNIELPVARLGISARGEKDLKVKLLEALQYGKGVVQVLPIDSSTAKVFSTKRACPGCGQSFAELDPRLFSFNSKQGWCTGCYGTGEFLSDFDAEQSGEERSWVEADSDPIVCETCQGARLNPIARSVKFKDESISEFTARSVDEATKQIKRWKLNAREQAIARDVLTEINGRLTFLKRVGLGYLQLDRAAPTLSGGESQRIRLAAQLGSNLRGVCYVLDEPTIGLHPRDNRILLDALGDLAAHRNTLVVVEHDEDTIRRADHVIDLGPGAGVRGGQIVGEGTVQDLLANPSSITGRYLRDPVRHGSEPKRKTSRKTTSIWIRKAHLHNLHDVEVQIPLQRLVVVTGVSGSGKSTLARDVLYTSARAAISGESRLSGCRALDGIAHIDRVLEVDQTPIGKTPRSCPATYVGIWDEIRKIFAGTAESRLRGYTAGRFSFNTAGGRCAACEGQGMQTIEMSFLPDVKLPCEMCHGQRFNDETLSVHYRECSIGEVLAMNMEDAVRFFEAHSSIRHVLQLLCDVGLGYLTLGQPSPTLSGGEAQRIKLVTELAKVRTDLRAPLRSKPKHTLYVLDEPTVGLHMADVEKLIGVLHRLVDAGNTVVVVEHDLDIIAEADWVIDMGPEAGSAGGRVVAQGAPQKLALRPGRSHTGVALNEFMIERGILIS
jgi:excinuclease ABC subunit A